MATMTDIEILYTVFENHYDDDSIDEVYLMAGCDFNYAYDMLMLPFETNDIKIKKPKNKTVPKQKTVNPREYYETKQPTNSIPLTAFMKNMKH